MVRSDDTRLVERIRGGRLLWLAAKPVVLYLWVSLYAMVIYVLAVFSDGSADKTNWSYVAALVAVTIVWLIVTAVSFRRWVRRYRALFRTGQLLPEAPPR